MNNTPDILKKIIQRKQQEIQAAQATKPLADLQQQAADAPATRGFITAMRQRTGNRQTAVIAEIKKASPSRGILREHFDPIEIAKSYAAHQATCLSVLTDRDFFQGAAEYLTQARAACQLPVLCKDFMINEYQIYAARSWGADCILLIAACLEDAQMRELQHLARELGMDVLVEVHDEAELQRALALDVPMLGINNRNLHTFETQLDTTLRLREQVPADCLLVTESGIHTREDVATMRAHQVNAFLVGEAFMRQADPGAALEALFMDNGIANLQISG